MSPGVYGSSAALRSSAQTASQCLQSASGAMTLLPLMHYFLLLSAGDSAARCPPYWLCLPCAQLTSAPCSQWKVRDPARRIPMATHAVWRNSFGPMVSMYQNRAYPSCIHKGHLAYRGDILPDARSLGGTAALQRLTAWGSTHRRGDGRCCLPQLPAVHLTRLPGTGTWSPL